MLRADYCPKAPMSKADKIVQAIAPELFGIVVHLTTPWDRTLVAQKSYSVVNCQWWIGFIHGAKFASTLVINRRCHSTLGDLMARNVV
jgi:hypothetical protein